MSEASLAAQRLAVTAMRAFASLFAQIPAANIFDRSGRPEVFPCIIVGEGQTVGDDVECLDASVVHMDFHVWTKEDGFVLCKSLAGDVRRALRRLSGLQDGFQLDFNFTDSRYLRDPDGEHSHGVVTFSINAWEPVT